MIYLALSCLQGRPMRAAFDELRPLADGIQLTPGNHPSPRFREHVAAHPTLVHHGFAFEERAVAAWRGGEAIDSARSVHPPQVSFAELASIVERAETLPVLETMYPGERLGCADELRWAMARGLRLAVDISHLWIQRCAGVLDDATLACVLDYDRIAEIHVSANDGTRDQHAPLRDDTFGLAWARERLAAGAAVVFESYLHKLSADERRRQVALVRAA